MDQLDGDKLKPTYEIYVNPTAPKFSPSHLSCRRPIWNTNSSILLKRDSSSATHKPFDKHKLRNNKQQSQPVNMSWLFKSSNDKPKNNQNFSNINGDDSSQESSYKAEIHELYAEMLSMRAKSEMQSHLATNMCRLETPSRTVESEPVSVLNTCSPGRPHSWILPSEMPSIQTDRLHQVSSHL